MLNPPGSIFLHDIQKFEGKTLFRCRQDMVCNWQDIVLRWIKACPRAWFPKSRQKFPQARNCRGSRPPAGCTKFVRRCSFRKAAGISASQELPRLQNPGRDFERVPRPPRPKSQQIFPRPLSSVVRLFCNNPTRKWSAYHF